MLLTEDEHLDIEKVKQLNETEVKREKKTWGGVNNFVNGMAYTILEPLMSFSTKFIKK